MAVNDSVFRRDVLTGFPGKMGEVDGTVSCTVTVSCGPTDMSASKQNEYLFPARVFGFKILHLTGWENFVRGRTRDRW